MTRRNNPTRPSEMTLRRRPTATPPGARIRRVRGAARRAALRRVQDQGRAACRPISSMPACSTTAPSWAAWRNSMHAAWSTSGVAFDMLFGPAYKGITLAAARGHRAGAARPQRALCLQPQGSQGPRRRRHAGRRAGRRARADRRRRDLGRHLGARVDRDDHAPPAATPLRRGDRARPPGKARDRRRPRRARGVRCSTSRSSWACRSSSIATLDDLLQYLQRHQRSRAGVARGRVAAYRERYGV